MLNSRPNNERYKQGNYLPINKDKVIKLNDERGVYYRSSWEYKVMFWLDTNESILRWGAECLTIPYQSNDIVNGELVLKEHCYYPDFYYELKIGDKVRCVVAEVKPYKEYKMVQTLLDIKENKINESDIKIPDGGKKLKNFEYDLKTAQKNLAKWETIIRWCDIKGYEFKIITELNLKNN
jgi:hypothetical protein